MQPKLFHGNELRPAILPRRTQPQPHQHQQRSQQQQADASCDDFKLTTSCLLQYCAQWPQHRPYVQAALQQDGFNLEYLAGTPFQLDKDLVLAAVNSRGAALQFAPTSLRGNRQVVLAAVANDPFALGFASAGLRADAEVVLAALQRDPAALAMADPCLFRDRDFMLAAIKLDATAATYAAPALLVNADFRSAAKASNPYVGHWFVDTEHFVGLQHPEAQADFSDAEQDD